MRGGWIKLLDRSSCLVALWVVGASVTGGKSANVMCPKDIMYVIALTMDLEPISGHLALAVIGKA